MAKTGTSSQKKGPMQKLKRLVIPLLASLCLQMPMVAYAQTNIPSIGDTARTALSPVAEYKLGRSIMVQIEQDPAYVKDDVLNEYLFVLGNKLVGADPTLRGELVNDFTFFGVKDRTLNAFALPGGFIGVHTGLILTTETESELASVLSHEVGHVSQRHIARMIASSEHDILIPLASAALALVAAAAGGGGNAAMGALVAGQGVAIQKQINFTREAEKEADRVGFQILKQAGFDINDMPAFFLKMQNATRLYNDAPSQYLRTHPLTSQRIADIELRIREEHYRQHVDNVDFQLIRSKARVVQGDMGGGTYEAEKFFTEQVKKGTRYQMAAGYYGLALIALQNKDPNLARLRLNEARKIFSDSAIRQSLALRALDIEIMIESGKTSEAIATSKAAIDSFPSSRTMSNLYVRSLARARRYDDCVRYLRKMSQRYREDAQIRRTMASIYSEMGKPGMMHFYMAEYYHLMEANQMAIEQLDLARKEKDVTFYDQSLIDAREREWKQEIRDAKE